MANHPSALKRARQAKKRQGRNRASLSAMKTSVKKFDLALKEKNADAVKTALQAAISSLARSASKGVIPKKRASRKSSRIALKANRIAATFK